ncbi:MAG: DMT family transporter [Candidatus Velthaea sp.]
MEWKFLAPALLAIGAGGSFVVQSALNAQLRVALNSPVRAGFISYLGGTLAMAVVALLTRDSWAYAADFGRSPSWQWTGGVFGAVYILISIVLFPRLGAATVFALLVTGQMLASIAFDHTGAFGLPQRSIDVPRVVGALLLVAGVALIRRA